MTEIEILAKEVGEKLKAKGWMLATAESCTGGWVGQAITSISGSSEWFDCGFITYSNTAKRELLGVKTTTLARHGAVSEATARAMAEGALARGHADIAVAVTGIAGPGGGTLDKPVGTVCFAWIRKNEEATTERRQFVGDREAIRRQAVAAVLQGIVSLLTPEIASV
jgi:nicotinamide-nucleotide amidase